MTASPPAHPVTLPRGVTSADSGCAVRRILGIAVAAPSTAVLVLAAYLTPSPEGMGTHEALGLPACGWVEAIDLPCPTCGMTTAFAHATDGHLLESFLTQPMGFALAITTAIAMMLGYYVAFTGSRIGSALAGLWRPGTGWILAGAFLVAWIYKIATHRGMI